LYRPNDRLPPRPEKFWSLLVDEQPSRDEKNEREAKMASP
jgi:P pilus assembly chaperone PapD